MRRPLPHGVAASHSLNRLDGDGFIAGSAFPAARIGRLSRCLKKIPRLTAGAAVLVCWVAGNASTERFRAFAFVFDLIDQREFAHSKSG